MSVLVSNCFWFDRLIPCIFSYTLSSQRAASCGLVYLSWLSIRSFDTSIRWGYVTFACVDSLGLEFWTVWFGSTLVRFVPISALWNWRSSESMRCFRKWAFVCLLFPFGWSNSRRAALAWSAWFCWCSLCYGRGLLTSSFDKFFCCLLGLYIAGWLLLSSCADWISRMMYRLYVGFRLFWRSDKSNSGFVWFGCAAWL